MKNDNLMFAFGILIIIIGVVYGVATETAYNYGSDSQRTISYSPSSYSPSECRNIINKAERQDCINKYNALRECLRNGVTEESLSNKGTCTDGIDNDCDGLIDLQEISCGREPIVCDADLDGYGKDNVECPQLPPYDCDDNDANINPGEQEDLSVKGTCTDGIDNDCDGLVDLQDDGCGAVPPVCDGDGDGYLRMDAGCGGTDCDDNNYDVNPGEYENFDLGNCHDYIDNDCDTFQDFEDTGCGGPG